jgi:ABC-2 type transport system permease protein
MTKLFYPFRKYLRVISASWAEYTAYRLNFVMWRMRMVMQILVVYFLWWALFSEQPVLFGYTQARMLSYVLLSSIFRSIVLGTRTMEIGEVIHRGDLSYFLMRPMNFFRYYMARDVADKGLNAMFAVGEVSLLVMILRPPVFLQTDGGVLAMSAIALFLAVILYFYFSVLLGFLGFWIPDFWGPRFISFVLIEFFAGGLFPLDILPESLYRVSLSLPFAYILYFPLKVYLGTLTPAQMLSGFVIGSVWTVLIAAAVGVLWRMGLRTYTAERR